MGPHLTDSLTIITDHGSYSRLMGQRQLRVPKALMYKSMQQLRQSGINMRTVSLMPATDTSYAKPSSLATEIKDIGINEASPAKKTPTRGRPRKKS